MEYENKSHKVCKAGFCSIFDVKDGCVDNALKKHTLTGTPVPDNRGKCDPVNKIHGITAKRVKSVCSSIVEGTRGRSWKRWLYIVWEQTGARDVRWRCQRNEWFVIGFEDVGRNREAVCILA